MSFKSIKARLFLVSTMIGIPFFHVRAENCTIRAMDHIGGWVERNQNHPLLSSFKLGKKLSPAAGGDFADGKYVLVTQLFETGVVSNVYLCGEDGTLTRQMTTIKDDHGLIGTIGQ